MMGLSVDKAYAEITVPSVARAIVAKTAKTREIITIFLWNFNQSPRFLMEYVPEVPSAGSLRMLCSIAHWDECDRSYVFRETKESLHWILIEGSHPHSS